MKLFNIFLLSLGLVLFISCRSEDQDPVLSHYTESFTMPSTTLSGEILYTKSDNDRVYMDKISFTGLQTESEPITKIILDVFAENNNPNGSPHNAPHYQFVQQIISPTNTVDFGTLNIEPKMFVGRNEFPMKKLKLVLKIEKQQGNPSEYSQEFNY